MRIIAGEFKGRRVSAVPGDSTRPSSDMLREAFASTVVSAREDGFEGASVLDAFAGSGAVGIEMLSRGAARCQFVDASQKAISIIETNLSQLELAPGRAHVTKGDSFELLGVEDGLGPVATGLHGAPYDVVFLDPPYAVDAPKVCTMLRAMARCGMLSDGAIAAYELPGSPKGRKKGKKADKNALPEDVQAMLVELGEGFAFLKAKAYGKSQIVYFAYSAS